MSNPKEQEKLTPASRKSYDGSTPMPDNEHREEQSPDPDKGDNAQDEKSHEDEEKEQENEQENRENRLSLADLFVKIFFSSKTEQYEGEKELVGEIIDLAVDKGNGTKKEVTKRMAGLLWQFTTSEREPGSDDNLARQEQQEQEAAAVNIYEVIKAYVEDPSSGFDSDLVFDELAKIATSDNPPPVAENDVERQEFFEDRLRTQVLNASKETLEKLHTEWQKLKTSIKEHGEIQDKVYGQLLAADESLSTLVEAKEEPATQKESGELTEYGLEKAFAEMIVRVFDAKAKFDLKQEERAQAERKEATEEDKKRAKLMMNILLSPEDSDENKQKMVRALLVKVPLEGDETADNEAVRNEILQMARNAGLDTTTIEVDEVAEETDIEKVNEWEEILHANTFEALVEKQLMEGSIEDIEKIRDAWFELLNDATEDELKEDAKEAIKVLGDIITFRKEQKAAHARGERVDPRRVAKPRQLENDSVETADDADKEGQDNEETKAKFISLLLKMFTGADLSKNADKQIVENVTRYLVVTARNFDEQVLRISRLLSYLPATDKRALFINTIQAVAITYGIFDFPDVQESNISESESQEELEALLKASLADKAGLPLKEMRDVWAKLLKKSDMDKQMKQYVQEATEQAEKLLPSKKTIAREQAIETYVESIDTLFVAHPELLKSHEAEAVNALVAMALAPYQLDEKSFELVHAEQALARLLVAFTDKNESDEAARLSQDVRKLILDRAKKLELNENTIFYEYSQLIDNKTIEGVSEVISSKKDRLEIIVRESLAKATSEQLKMAMKAWDEALAPSAEKKDDFHELAHKAVTSLTELASTQKQSAEQPDTPENEAERQQWNAIHKIRAIEGRIAGVENEEFRLYLAELVEKMKGGMTAEEVAAELKSLGDKDIPGAAEIDAETKIWAMNSLSDLKDGITMNHNLYGQLLAEDEARRTFMILEDEARRASNKYGMQDYLNELVRKLQEEQLTPEEMQEALAALNKRARSIGNQIRKDAESGDKDELKEATVEILDLEGAINKYRDFLVEAIHKGLSEEDSKEAPQRQQSQKTAAFIEEVNDINTAATKDDITRERFEEYIADLKKVLSTPGSLTNEQIAGAYKALLIQADVVRNKDKKASPEEKLAFTKTYQEEQALEAALYGELIKRHQESARAVRNEINTEVMSQRSRFGYKVLAPVAGGAYTPVYEEADRSTGMPTVDIRDDVIGITNAPQANITVPDVFYDEHDVPLDPAASQRKHDSLQRRISNLDNPDVYRDVQILESLHNDLQVAVSDAIRNDTSPGLTNLRSLSGARALVAQIARHRQALNVKRGYKGLLERRAELDENLYGKDRFIHEVLGERMKRIRDRLQNNNQQYSDEDIVKYYRELQRWANIVLSNDVRRNPKNANKTDALRLTNTEWTFYNQFVNRKITPATLNANRNQILNNLTTLGDPDNISNGDFLRYFMKNVPDPENPNAYLGIPYNRPEDMGLYAPESLGATMEEIAKAYGSEFQTGGERELMNAEGEFMYNNFLYWIRKKINEDVDYNKDGQIQPYGKIIIKLDMGQISMYELLLLIPEYTAQRNFEIRMHDGKADEIHSGWGEKTENPDFGWGHMDFIAAEMEFRQMTHELRTQFTATNISNNKEQYLGLMRKLHHPNHWTRSANVFLMFGLPSSVVNGTKDIDDCFNDEKQGILGKAMSDMLVSYNYLSELTDYWKHPTTGKEKTFNQNMFYRFLEPNGANRFLIKMAEGALGYNLDAKKMYAQFIGERIEAIAARYMGAAGLTQEERDRIEQIKNEWKPDNNDTSLDVNFTENEQLKHFITLVERNVLRNAIKDEDIALLVRDDLVPNLRGGYFNKLKKMTIGKVTSKSSNRLLMTEGTTQFGEVDVEIGNGQTMKMKHFLDSFDVDQILRFDYSNDPNDLNNPFRNITNEAALRRTIDTFMDPTASPNNYRLFKRNEQMMLAFTKHITRVDRKDLNHFRDAEELEYSRDMIKRAFRYINEKVYGIDSVESEYAWWWVRDYVYLWGIGAWLDCDGIGFRWDGKIINPGAWRPRRQGKDSGGNAHTFDEFLAMSLPFPHHVQVSNISQDEPLGHRSIFSWFQGGEGGYITPRALREFDRRSNYTFQQNAEALYVDNTLENSSELIDLLAKTEFDVSGIVSFDVLGNVVYDFGKAREVFGKWRKAARYAYGKNGVDYRAKIWANGREKTLYEHFFGPKTRALNELIYRTTRRTLDFMYKDPADAVMMSIIAAEVAEHRGMFTASHHWTLENVLELEKFLYDFMTEYKQEEDSHGERKSKPDPGTLFNRTIWKGALQLYHTAYYKMYMTELNGTFWSGLFNGVGASIKEFFKGKWIW